jgi:hypothetical protein
MSHLARYDDLNTKTIGYLTFMSVILLIVIILLLQALTYNWIEWQEEAKLIKQGYPSSDEVIQQQLSTIQLKAPTKVMEEVVEEPAPAGNDGAGAAPAQPEPKQVERIHIPIERAQQRVLLELGAARGQAAPST